MMILEKSSLDEEMYEVDHPEKLVFLVILQNLKKCLENVLVLVLMEYLLMDHPGQLTRHLTMRTEARSDVFKRYKIKLELRTEVYISHRMKTELQSEEKNPPEQSLLGILLTKKILKSRVIRIHYVVLEMFVNESLEMIVDESLDMIEDESLDMIVDESFMVEDKSLEKLVDEALKLDEEHFEYVVLEMFVNESLEMIVDESLDMIEDESLDMIVDESFMVEDKSLEKLVDEALKLDEEHFEYVIAYCELSHSC
nr:hypothetical protein [Tanacetum cinerariifolium]